MLAGRGTALADATTATPALRAPRRGLQAAGTIKQIREGASRSADAASGGTAAGSCADAAGRRRCRTGLGDRGELAGARKGVGQPRKIGKHGGRDLFWLSKF